MILLPALIVALSPVAGWQPAVNTPTPAEAQASAPATDHKEERIGGWALRTDRKARTCDIICMSTGVIELAARTSDGKVEIVIRDNGVRLSASFETPRCMAFSDFSGYNGNAESGNTLAEFATELSRLCTGSGYEADIQSWLRDFPAAARTLEARARALYGSDLIRCIEPPFRPDVPPPPHPRCGFPPPGIGENHPK